MIILPAIDIQNGSCVRLVKGDFSTTKVYATNPLDIAKDFQDKGAEYLHIIDLDGADDAASNKELIKEIKRSISIPIQVGGGIRTLEQIEDLLDSGIDRVIVGTMPFQNKEDFLYGVKRYKERIVVSLDCKDELVQIRGWKETTNINLFDFIKELEDLGITTIVVTDIAKDGMLEGTNMDLYKRLAKESKLKIVASGGVTSLKDVKELTELKLYGAIIGKALYEKNLSLKEVIECSQNA